MAATGLVAMAMLGCATAQSPVNGALWQDVKGGVMATEAYGGSAKGEACASSILGIVATGDASINTAKKTAASYKSLRSTTLRTTSSASTLSTARSFTAKKAAALLRAPKTRLQCNLTLGGCRPAAPFRPGM